MDAAPISHKIPRRLPCATRRRKRRSFMLCRFILSFASLVVLPHLVLLAAAGEKYKPHHEVNAKNPIVFFDITIGDKAAGRIEMELFADTCPKTAENFLQLCVGTKNKEGKTLHYKGSTFHRVIP